MAGFVSKIKDKVHRRSGSNTFEGAAKLSTDTSTGISEEAAGVSSEHVAPPAGRTYVSVGNSAFHVHRGHASGNSLDVNSGALAPGPSQADATEHHRRGLSLEDGEARVGDIIPERASSKHGTSISNGAHHTRSKTLEELSPTVEQSASSQALRPRSQGTTTAKKSTPRKVPTQLIPERVSSQHVASLDLDMHSPHRRSLFGHHASKSLDTNNQPLPPLPNSSSSTQRDMNGLPSQVGSTTPRASSEYPPRRDSLPRKPLPSTPGRKVAAPAETRGKENVDPTTTGDLAQSAGLANMYLQQPKQRDVVEHAAKERILKSGDLRLPAGFDLRDSVRTTVTEEQRPAVVYETVVNQRHEIIQQAISRDIHIHHYFTYEQPIKVVEVLPARHFHLDVKTGIKTEIEAPVGWQMPANLTPRSPDASVLTAYERHYVVDEQNPTGALEAPPLKHELGYDNLRDGAVRGAR
ncbi:hypothetical protein LTS08_000676 [Lithohypha guttulata]|nr:hypothetical protein LTS08_000676 [Lithohypha guttulata]